MYAARELRREKMAGFPAVTGWPAFCHLSLRWVVTVNLTFVRPYHAGADRAKTAEQPPLRQEKWLDKYQFLGVFLAQPPSSRLRQVDRLLQLTEWGSH
jgi:hypothetical protein